MAGPACRNLRSRRPHSARRPRVGLSIGTDVPLDLAYLDEVAAIVERLEAPTYSEHLAFTRVPGRDLANLLPLPKTEDVAESIVAKVRTVQSRIPVPFLLENISYAFDWPDFDLVGCRVSQPDLPRDRRGPSCSISRTSI